MLESSLGDLRRLRKDGGDAIKGLRKAQYSYIKKRSELSRDIHTPQRQSLSPIYLVKRS
jgi:hypothetical protein